MTKKPLVINLFGTPGAGKSTGAAYIFAMLKMKGVNAELVSEFAKDKVWEANKEVFNNQAYIFGKQSFRQSRCAGKVDVIVTDSPLPLSIMYNNNPATNNSLTAFVLDVFNSYNNKNYLLTRVKPYNTIGRHQTQEESDALKQPLVDLLNGNNIPYMELTGCKQDYDIIVDMTIQYLGLSGEEA